MSVNTEPPESGKRDMSPTERDRIKSTYRNKRELMRGTVLQGDMSADHLC